MQVLVAHTFNPSTLVVVVGSLGLRPACSTECFEDNQGTDKPCHKKTRLKALKPHRRTPSSAVLGHSYGDRALPWLLISHKTKIKILLSLATYSKSHLSPGSFTSLVLVSDVNLQHFTFALFGLNASDLA